MEETLDRVPLLALTGGSIVVDFYPHYFYTLPKLAKDIPGRHLDNTMGASISKYNIAGIGAVLRSGAVLLSSAHPAKLHG